MPKFKSGWDKVPRQPNGRLMSRKEEQQLHRYDVEVLKAMHGLSPSQSTMTVLDAVKRLRPSLFKSAP